MNGETRLTLGTRIREFFRDSTQLGPVLLALVVGLVGGAGAILFRFLIAQSRELFFGGSAWLLPEAGDYRVIALPALGLLTVTAIVRRWAREAQGHGVPEVQYAVRQRGGRMRPRVAAVKALASAICIGSGGSVGREGPIVQIGSALGSTLGRSLGLREDSVKLLLACGAAAGIGGTFNAPIAGVLFAMEVILGSFTGRSFGLLVLASVASTALVQSVLGREPAFALQEVFTLVSPLELPLYLVLGIVAGGLSVVYVKTFYATERAFNRWSVSPYLKAATGGLIVGVIGYVGIRYLGGAHLFGVGYEGVEKALALTPGAGELTAGVLVLLVALKILATSTTLAAGGSGGVFAPALYIGAMAGGAFGLAVNAAFPAVTASAGAYALVGMGALFAGAAHAPISSVLILFEMTDDYQIILPLMLAVVVSHLVAARLSEDSIYSVKLRHLGGMSPLQAARRSVLDLVLVVDAMSPEAEPVGSDTPVTDLAVRFRDRAARAFPVVDDSGSLVGLVTLTEVQNALLEEAVNGRTAKDVMIPDPLTCRPNETLRAVLQRISDHEVGQVPVVDPEDPRRLVGLLGREQILWAVGEMASEHARLIDHLAPLQPSGDVSVEVLLEVSSQHLELCFKRLRELRLPEQCLVTSLRRGHRVIVPNGDTIIEPADLLAIVTTRANEARLRRWVQSLRRPSAGGASPPPSPAR
jgi:CIC family chloride channel protein